MYTKKQLTIVNGYLKAPDSTIVVVDPKVIVEANVLETLSQKADYLMAQPAATPMPTFDGFERKSIMDEIVPKFTVTTPMLDKRAEDALAIMEELDNVETANNANQVLELFAELFEFVKNDYVIDHGNDGSELVRIDTPTLGNILELTDSEVVEVIAKCSGLVKTDKDDEDLESLRSLLDELIKAADDGRLDVVKADDEMIDDIAKAFNDKANEPKADEPKATED
jgi:hypothetical protein